MTTDAKASIQFQLIPEGDIFNWEGRPFRKIAIHTAVRREDGHDTSEKFMFPFNFKVDMTVSKVTEILGEPTEPGVWD